MGRPFARPEHEVLHIVVAALLAALLLGTEGVTGTSTTSRPLVAATDLHTDAPLSAMT